MVVAYYCSVELVKVFSYWLSSKFELHITGYQFLVLLFHYFRTNFSPTWKHYTMKYIVNTTIATTPSTSRKLQMMQFKRVSSVNEGSSNVTFAFKLPGICIYPQIRQDRSVHAGEILLVPSPDEGGGWV